MNSRWSLTILFAAALLPFAGWSASIQNAAGGSVEATEKAFKENRATKGVVLLDVNWGRRWKCGAFENAELRKLSFDRLPLDKTSDEEPADLVLAQEPSLLTKPTFSSYALLLEPGEYVLTGVDIKVARSASEISHAILNRSQLWKEGKAIGGTFKVAAGETVYIGNFFLDCYQEPQPWRYYTEGKRAFKKHLKQYERAYPFLDTDAVVYRLFETESMGRPYDLN